MAVDVNQVYIQQCFNNRYFSDFHLQKLLLGNIVINEATRTKQMKPRELILFPCFQSGD